MLLLFLFFMCINLIAFLTMGHDKTSAKRRARRIPEKTLFVLAAAGGAFGIFWGMRTFRHKTKHLSFKLGIPALMLLNAAGYSGLYMLATGVIR